MAIFSCSACGSHAFRLSPDLKQAECDQCRTPLGSWLTLRAKIQHNLRSLHAHQLAVVEFSGKTRH
jgi:RNase P subunit RPR2